MSGRGFDSRQLHPDTVRPPSNKGGFSFPLFKTLRSQQLTQSIYVDEKIKQYILAIVFATRKPADYKLQDIAPYINYGVSPRATLALYNAAKTHAFLAKRHYVIPEDVKAVCPEALRHTIHLTYEAEADHVTADMLIKKIINTIPTP